MNTLFQQAYNSAREIIEKSGLCEKQILTQPLLYLSYYFKKNRMEYYDRLMDVRQKGDWENWIKFFLKGIAEVAVESTDSAKRILALREKYNEILSGYNNSNYINLLEQLFMTPSVTKNKVRYFGYFIPYSQYYC